MGESQLELLERLLARIDEYARDITRAQLEMDLDTWLKVSRALELAAQCCLDLAMEMVGRRGLGAPETYRDAFVRLSQAGLITPTQSIELQAWVGLRNVLAHMYTAVDLDQVYAAMTDNKSVLREFGRLAAAELSQDP
jgi:uncharacterized protein YutE (UPF0331/DUF86 family)